MSNLNDFEEKKEAINAILNDQVELPTIPVDNYLQEAENLYHWSLDDAEKLNMVGITTKMIEDLPVRTGACRYAQSMWFKDRFSQEEAQKQWKIQSPEAYDLRDELIHDFRFAYRKDSLLLGRISAIAEGNGHADMIQDLSDLSVLGKANLEPLQVIGLNVVKLDKAAVTSDAMADLLATANGDKAEQNATKMLRDKAFTYLKELVDEIREAGKYVFWKNKDRYKGYISHYRSRHSSPDLEVVE